MKCLKCLQQIDLMPGHYGLHPKCFTTWFRVPIESKFVDLARRSSPQDEKSFNETQNGSFFHGKFKKYSANLHGQSYILKMKEADAPELPDIEYLSNQIADSLDLPVAEFFMIDFEDERVFVTKNFIKKDSGISDLQHIYHFRSDEKHDCETLLKVITDKTKRPYDVGVFIDTLLFDALIGNHDRHGRNLGFIVTPGKIVLSPIYDNISYLGLESGKMLNADFNPLGKVATKETLEPSMKHYVSELSRLGHLERVKAFSQRIRKKHIEDLVENSFCTPLMKQAMKKLINKRLKELEDETNKR
jgi:HipA-like C-terminal domain